MPPTNPDLSAFSARDGKLVFHQDTGDGIFSIFDTVDDLKQVDNVGGGKANDFARLFSLPGLTHCSGWPGTSDVDFLGAVVDWVEKGQAP